MDAYIIFQIVMICAIIVSKCRWLEISGILRKCPDSQICETLTKRIDSAKTPFLRQFSDFLVDFQARQA
jgi:hypothetical protein